MWKTLNKEDEVDAGEKWVLSTRVEPELIQLREETLCLPRYVDKFSLLVQNKTVYDADKLANHEANVVLAKRLVVDLPTMTMGEIPLRLEMVLRPASGHARFSISTRNEQPLFADRHSIDLSWKTAQDEPEHKGYLDAREVVGRIMDDPKYRELARLVTRRVQGEMLMAQEQDRLQHLLNEYRPGRFVAANRNDSDLLSRLLVPWGFSTKPDNSQPTRGFWGSRRQPNDPELEEIARLMGDVLYGLGKDADWYRQLNCMFVYTDPRFLDVIRDELLEGLGLHHVFTFNQVYSPGRIFDNEQDFESLIRFTNECVFDDTNSQYRAVYWWSFFRCLCYHRKTAKVDPTLVRIYLEQMLSYFKTAPFLLKNEKKYGLHVLLFALRSRDPGLHGFLPNSDYDSSTLQFQLLDDKLIKEYNHLIDDGCLSGQEFPKSMLAGMGNMVTKGDNFSKYVRRFLNYEDTLADREMGAGLATS